MIKMMTEMMTETLTGLQVPESFVSVTGSGCLSLHLPGLHVPVTGSDPVR